ncbi:MAG: hypothetical protein JWM44_3135 [Bacilli bacterium]|nr:hypothetical protein [Bacilli bacterium]
MVTMEPSRVIVIRHGEKSQNKNNPSLQMPKGYERAGALAPFLPFKFKKIDILYAPSIEPGSQSTRVVETITPLSRYLNLPILTTHVNSKDDIRKMVKLIRTNPKYHGKTVLICWHHNRIPFLTKEFNPNNINQVPHNWPNDRFDVIWLLKKTPNGIIFSQEPEKLLFGDKTSVIPLKK